MSFLNLTNEVYVEIFKYLQTTEKLKLFSVNKRWHRLLCHSIEIQKILKFHVNSQSSMNNLEKILAKCSKSLRSLCIITEGIYLLLILEKLNKGDFHSLKSFCITCDGYYPRLRSENIEKNLCIFLAKFGAVETISIQNMDLTGVFLTKIKKSNNIKTLCLNYVSSLNLNYIRSF